MKIFKTFLFLIAIVGFVTIIIALTKKNQRRFPPGGQMQLTSRAFVDDQLIPKQYTCDGANIHPPLAISDVRTEVQDLVLIVDDPDAPAGTWTHWLVWNIDPSTREIPEGTVPDGATEGTTDFAKVGWGGPCPPTGTHRYRFQLYVLDIRLNLPATTDRKQLDAALTGHVLDQTTLIGRYARR